MTHSLSPIAFSVAGFDVRWYGLMYLTGFVIGWILARNRARSLYQDWTKTNVDDLATFAMLGVVLGGRLGYVLFYDLPVYINDPGEILRVWNGGMSFHGGLLGVLCAFFYFSYTRKKSFLEVSDFVAPLIPQALFFGRIGNFINGELWGKTSDVPWAIIFPQGGPWPRHPSQLYEAILEGIVLGVILLIYARKRRPLGKISGLFAIGYSVFRFGVEFIRVPDEQLGYLAFDWLTMGQILCLPLFLIGLWAFFRQTEETK